MNKDNDLSSHIVAVAVVEGLVSTLNRVENINDNQHDLKKILQYGFESLETTIKNNSTHQQPLSSDFVLRFGAMENKIESLYQMVHTQSSDLKEVKNTLSELSEKAVSLDTNISWLIKVLSAIGVGIVGFIAYYHKPILAWLQSH